MQADGVMKHSPEMEPPLGALQRFPNPVPHMFLTDYVLCRSDAARSLHQHNRHPALPRRPIQTWLGGTRHSRCLRVL
jgi:hypothetical protein